MNIVIKIVGAVIILVGVLYLSKPNIVRRLMEFFKQGKRIYLIGYARFAIGVVFLLGADECYGYGKHVIAALGILFLISALSIFMLGAERVKAILNWYLKRSLRLHRVIAVLVLVIGAAIVYFARQ